MSKNKTNIFLIIVFIAIITVPQIVFRLINNQEEEISALENRRLNSKPTLTLSTLSQYSKQFENYYNDYLPFRTQLRKIWAKINYNIFNCTIDENVIIGKDNWLFYRADQLIEQTQSILQYSDEYKENIVLQLNNTIEKLRQRNIDTYIFILPNKENVYREKLPDTIPIKNEITTAEDIIKYIKENSDINIIYPKDELMKVKEKYEIYRKYDTHWNRVGSCIGVVELQKAIDSNFSYDINEIEVEEINEKDTNDLAICAGLEEQLFQENWTRVKNFYPEIEYTAIQNDRFQEYTSTSKNNKTVLVIGDSYLEDTKFYFSKLYKKVYYVYREKYSPDMLEKLKPDIIVIEAIERLVKELINPIV